MSKVLQETEFALLVKEYLHSSRKCKNKHQLLCVLLLGQFDGLPRRSILLLEIMEERRQDDGLIWLPGHGVILGI